MELIKSINWRYATKLFDRKSIPEDDLEKLIEVVRMAPTSLGLQPFRLLVVKDQSVKELLDGATMRGQRQPGSSSHVFVFAASTEINRKYYEAYVSRASTLRNLNPDKEGAFREKVAGYVESKTENQLPEWVDKQVYLAVGQLLLAAAQIGIDACPMEGIHKEAVDNILGLKKRGLRTVLLCPLGYRSNEDEFQNVKKVRLPKEDFVIKL